MRAPGWGEADVLAAILAAPTKPVAQIAREAGWPRTKLRRHIVRWSAEGKIGNTLPAGCLPALTAAPVGALQPRLDGRPRIGRMSAGLVLGAVGVALAAIGATATITYSLEASGLLASALACTADVMVLLLPSAAACLWRGRSRLMAMAARTMWSVAVAVAVTLANMAGFIGQHSDQFVAGREVEATGRAVVLERLERLRFESKSITEQRSIGAITAELQNARGQDIAGLRATLAIAKRRDAIEADLLMLENKINTLPTVTAIDPSAAMLADVIRFVTSSKFAVTDDNLRRFRQTLFLVMPLCGGIVLALALAFAVLGARAGVLPVRAARYAEGRIQ